MSGSHRSDVRRERYRFIGAEGTAAGGRVLTWEKRIAGDSRVEQVTCDADWLYGQMVGAR